MLFFLKYCDTSVPSVIILLYPFRQFFNNVSSISLPFANRTPGVRRFTKEYRYTSHAPSHLSKRLIVADLDLNFILELPGAKPTTITFILVGSPYIMYSLLFRTFSKSNLLGVCHISFKSF